MGEGFTPAEAKWFKNEKKDSPAGESSKLPGENKVLTEEGIDAWVDQGVTAKPDEEEAEKDRMAA